MIILQSTVPSQTQYLPVRQGSKDQKIVKESTAETARSKPEVGGGLCAEEEFGVAEASRDASTITPDCRLRLAMTFKALLWSTEQLVLGEHASLQNRNDFSSPPIWYVGGMQAYSCTVSRR